MNDRLEILDVSKSFDGLHVLDKINVTAAPGQIVSVLGVSGSGKSTLLNIIAGLEKPDSGQVLLDGQDITGQSGLVGYMFQNDLLLPWRRVNFNVALPLILKGQDKKSALEKADKLLADFGLYDFREYYPQNLSGGMRRRVALLRTHLFSAQVCMFDEPFTGLDAITKKQVSNWFYQVLRKYNTTALFITHDVDEAILLSDKIYVMSDKPSQIIYSQATGLGLERDWQITVSPEFVSTKKQLLEVLKDNE